MKKKISLILAIFLIFPTIYASSLEKSMLDLNFLTYTFIENSKFEPFNKGGVELVINKDEPKVGDTVRVVITDNSTKGNIEMTLLSPSNQRTFLVKELSGGTGYYLAEILMTEKLEEKELTFLLSKEMILLYNSNKFYSYRFGEAKEVKQEEQKKAEQKKQEERIKAEEEKKNSEKDKIVCDYYKTEEVSGFSDFMFIEGEQKCEDLITQYEDTIYNKANEAAKKECEKISCSRTGCNCQQSFQEFPYEEGKMKCTVVSGRSQRRLSYTTEGACVCRC
ncbi:hypothetical protein HZA97_04295 [Candidatus Woesearchaeota archaeon]|nr:hypothetical protein [Candidatus Woesearchaeota archaeon]